MSTRKRGQSPSGIGYLRRRARGIAREFRDPRNLVESANVKFRREKEMGT